jgi:hypothetical protein
MRGEFRPDNGTLMGGLPVARKTRIDTRLRERTTVILAFTLCCSACSTTPDSGWTPFQVALFNPLQIFSEETDVHGYRMNLLYGKNANFRGVDFGMVGITKKTKGHQFNVFYSEAEEFSGLQLALPGLPGNRCTDLNGVQVGAVNIAEGRVRGWQFSFLSNEASDVSGGQVSGIVNRSRRVAGFQLALLVNETDDLHGLQIGVLNFNTNGILPFFPIFNFGFGSDPEEKTTGDADSSNTDD